jgi:hypothetical protein
MNEDGFKIVFLLHSQHFNYSTNSFYCVTLMGILQADLFKSHITHYLLPTQIRLLYNDICSYGIRKLHFTLQYLIGAYYDSLLHYI